MNRGFTLIELVFVCLLASLLAGALAAPSRTLRDRTATVVARDGLAALVLEARTQAPAHWGATVALEGPPWRAWVEAGDTLLGSLALGEDLGVTVVLSRDRTRARLSFDVLGLGRMAGETIRLRRGDAEAVLVVSAYGRITRR